ncbi:MAG: hypothetical protein ABI972_18090 [Acidobacteriota bacterium]
MKIDPAEIQKRFAALDDDDLLDVDRDELSELARQLYDEECARRGLDAAEALKEWEDEGGETDGGVTPGEFAEMPDDEGDDRPEWMDDGVCVCTFEVTPGAAGVTDVTKARAVLLAAEIPCSLAVNEEMPASEGHSQRKEVSLFVPGPLHLHALAVLDRDLFNATHEEEWQRHFEAISNDDLLALRPDIFTAGLLDRVARMKRVYAAEVARRGLTN